MKGTKNEMNEPMWQLRFVSFMVWVEKWKGWKRTNVWHAHKFTSTSRLLGILMTLLVVVMLSFVDDKFVRFNSRRHEMWCKHKVLKKFISMHINSEIWCTKTWEEFQAVLKSYLDINSEGISDYSKIPSRYINSEK